MYTLLIKAQYNFINVVFSDITEANLFLGFAFFELL